MVTQVDGMAIAAKCPGEISGTSKISGPYGCKGVGKAYIVIQEVIA